MTNDAKPRTPEWELLKARLKKDKCLACGSTKNLHLHHITYTEPRDIDFVTLCGTHHRKIHFQRRTCRAWSLKTKTVFKRLCWLMAEYNGLSYQDKKHIKKSQSIEDLYIRIEKYSKRSGKHLPIKFLTPPKV